MFPALIFKSMNSRMVEHFQKLHHRLDKLGKKILEDTTTWQLATLMYKITRHLSPSCLRNKFKKFQTLTLAT